MKPFIMTYSAYMFHHIITATIPYIVFDIAITFGSFDKDALFVLTTYATVTLIITLSFLYHDNNIKNSTYFNCVDIFIKTYFAILILCHASYSGYFYAYIGCIILIDTLEQTSLAEKGVDK